MARKKRSKYKYKENDLFQEKYTGVMVKITMRRISNTNSLAYIMEEVESKKIHSATEGVLETHYIKL